MSHEEKAATFFSTFWKAFLSSDTHQSKKHWIVTERLTKIYTQMGLHMMGYVVLTQGVANWELFAIVYLDSPDERTGSFCLHKTGSRVTM